MDGNHQVSVTTDDPVSAQGALEWAKKVYDEIVAAYGFQDQEMNPNNASNAVSQVTEDTPICPIHQAQMVKQQGKFGSFWSCHQRSPDGSWCTYRPSKD